MKNILLIITTLIFSTQAMATSDSVAVFHRPEKVTVLINERGESSRLQDMMSNFNADKYIHTITADQKVMITCGRNIEAASCTFTFYQSPEVVIAERSMTAQASLADLEMESTQNFEINFESSMNDKFSLEVKDGNIFFKSSKKILSK
ncbi:MAG: hypothetical protein H7177_10510 [Rhizobacter sp.]|nr:hypothetical protein [Bacteriovorax sp.]